MVKGERKMNKPIMLYEWVDENGDVEDFMTIPLSDNIKIRKVFDFPNAHTMICFGEEAKALQLDYLERG